ncbi:MAG: hypothetical protein ACLP6E_17265 [Acidimicrobiales bacterium]
MRRRVVVVLVAISLLATGCSAANKPSATPATQSAVEGPEPAGPIPSEIALMVCQSKAADEIQDVLGETAVVEDRTWKDDLYSCRYRFKTGTMVLSVKELSSWAQTYAYFAMLGRTLHETTTVPNLGQGAFQVRNGSVVVRKDWKILLVDITGLPSEFGLPPTTSGDVAATVAFIILGCWAGD